MGTSELLQLQGNLQRLTRIAELRCNDGSSSADDFILDCLNQLVEVEDLYYRIAVREGGEAAKIAFCIRRHLVDLMWLPAHSAAFSSAIEELRRALGRTPPSPSPLAYLSARALSMFERTHF